MKCQKEHRPQHKKECKKRAAELRDEILFKQPESSYLGDCPICCLPLPIDLTKSVVNACCCKQICGGCSLANKKRQYEEKLQYKCPFCRKVLPKTEEELNEQWLKRIEANDPIAIRQMGTTKWNEGDYRGAFEYFTKAAALGDVGAHYQLLCLHRNGHGVERDEKRELHHLTEAAIGGHPTARYYLARVEERNGQQDRAVRHYIIAAKLGSDESLGSVKSLYRAGHVSKDDFAAALRGHQAATDATKSPQREEAVEYEKRLAELRRRDI